MNNMSDWFSVEKIDSMTYAISEYGHWKQAHSYLFLGQRKAVLIDTGLGIANLKKKVREITNLPIMVITTHYHWDHVGSHLYFDEIGIGIGDLAWMEEGHFSKEYVISELMKERFKTEVPKAFHLEDYEIYFGKPEWIFKDMNLIDLGGRLLQVISTPGHTPGHICIWEEKTRYLVTGDLVYEGVLRLDYDECDIRDFMASLSRVVGINNIKRILPGHYNLNLKKDYVLKVKEAFDNLKSTNMLIKGSGLCQVNGIAIRL